MRRWMVAVLSIVVIGVAGGACGQTSEPPAGSTSLSIDLPGGATLDAVEMGHGPNVAILSHGATGTKEGFYPLMPLLADGGWRAIAYDAQGVGDSTGQLGSNRPGDLAAVVDHARADGAERIALVGASLGAVVSLETAADVEADGVVALSAYAGSQGGFPPIPVMLAVAEDNEPYATQVRRLGDELGVEPVIVTGEDHGTGMFTDHPELMEQVVAFLNDQVAGAASSQ
jgi:uncharacterized protein